MKKLIGLILAVSVLLGMAACGAKNKDNVNSGNAGNSVNAEQKDPSQQPDESPAPDGDDTAEETPDMSQSEENNGEDASDVPVDETPVEPAQPDEQPAVVTASHTDVTFKAAGDSFKLRPKGVQGEYTVTYSSVDAAIAEVSEDGTVTAVAPGTTTIAMQVKQGDTVYDVSCIIRCSWKAEEAPKSVDLLGVYESVMRLLGENAPFMMPVEGEILDTYYPGLSAIPCKQMVVQMAGMSAVAFEVAAVEVENVEDVETVRAILQSRVDAQASGGAWYPETIAAWEKAEVIVNGNYVAMIVAGEAQAEITAAYRALFN